MTLRSGLTGTAPLPAGDYVFQASSRDTVACQIPFRVGANSKEANIGNISMEIGPIAKNYGKPALPLKITGAIGVTKDFRLSDLKGKWVLIDFWGYWCGPCVGEALPKLADFYRTHQNKTDKFAILAFHENSVKTVEELKPKLRRLETEVWKGQPLPFPILLDSTGQTIKLWGVASYPTTILIDPEGHFYRGGSLDVLKQKVEQTTSNP